MSGSTTPEELPDPDLGDPQRLRALRRAGLLDAPRDPSFERATRLASRLLDTPVALFSVVDRERQFFASEVGLPEPWATARETPLSHSFCQYVVGSATPLVVEDAREHPTLRTNRAIADLDVIAYLGVPVEDREGNVLGSFCVIDAQPRQWNQEDLEVLGDIAGQVATEVRLRLALDDLAGEVRRRRDLVAMVAHDVRSPAGAVDVATQTLGRLLDDPPERVTGVLDGIRRQAQRIVRLSETLLEVEEGEVAPGGGPVDVPGLLADVVAGGRAGAPHRVTVDVADELTVATDRTALERIVTNLVDNALVHTDGPVEVAASHTGGELTVRVSDRGPGLPIGDLDRLFSPFERGDGDAPGHGLGLSIVRTLIDRLGGHLRTDSSPGSGTTVTVTLPVDRQSART